MKTRTELVCRQTVAQRIPVDKKACAEAISYAEQTACLFPCIRNGKQVDALTADLAQASHAPNSINPRVRTADPS